MYFVCLLKLCNFRLPVSPGSAEALVRCSGEIKYRLTAYCCIIIIIIIVIIITKFV